MAPTTSLSTRAGFASQGPSARVTDRMYGTSEVPTVHANGTADNEPSIGWRRRIGQRPPSRRRGGHCGGVDRQPLNGTMRTGNHAPPGTSEPWSSSARDACPPTDKGDDCGLAARPSSDRLAVARLRVVLAMHRLDARAAAGEMERRDAQVPDQTGPHHAIHRAVPCALLVSSRHAAG